MAAARTSMRARRAWAAALGAAALAFAAAPEASQACVIQAPVRDAPHFAPCNNSPQASFTATPNPVLPGATLTLDATASFDTDGTIANYAWDLDGNGTYETNGGTSPTLTTSYPTRGARTIGLQVTDNGGATGTITRTVAVTMAPTAQLTASPPTPDTGQTVTLDASGSSDPDVGGAIVKYEWDFNNDGTYDAVTTTSTTTTSFATSGVHTARVRVTDQDGATATATASVTAQNRPPVPNISAPTPAVVGATANFDASGSADPDGTIATYEWDLNGDNVYEISGTSPQASTTYLAPGTVTVHLRVTDNEGASAATSKTVVITRAPTASFTAGPNPVSLHVPVSFDASASSDPEGPIAKYEWDLDGNGTFETDTATTPTVAHTYPVAGTYAVGLRVTDADGATATTTVNVVSQNLLPLPALSVGPNPAVVDQPVTLDAGGSSDPDGSVASYAWDLDGNGTFETAGGSTPTIAHAYPNPGAYDVGVRVTDNDGGTAVARVRLVVDLPPAPPPGGAATPPLALRRLTPQARPATRPARTPVTPRCA